MDCDGPFLRIFEIPESLDWHGVLRTPDPQDNDRLTASEADDPEAWTDSDVDSAFKVITDITSRNVSDSLEILTTDGFIAAFNLIRYYPNLDKKQQISLCKTLSLLCSKLQLIVDKIPSTPYTSMDDVVGNMEYLDLEKKLSSCNNDFNRSKSQNYCEDSLINPRYIGLVLRSMIHVCVFLVSLCFKFAATTPKDSDEKKPLSLDLSQSKRPKKGRVKKKDDPTGINPIAIELLVDSFVILTHLNINIPFSGEYGGNDRPSSSILRLSLQTLLNILSLEHIVHTFSTKVVTSISKVMKTSFSIMQSRKMTKMTSRMSIIHQDTDSTVGLTDNIPPEIQSNPLEVTNTIGLADSSSNYLSLKSKATPGDRGDEKLVTGPQVEPVADLREAKGEVNREADGRTTSDGEFVCNGNEETDDFMDNMDIIKMDDEWLSMVVDDVKKSHCIYIADSLELIRETPVPNLLMNELLLSVKENLMLQSSNQLNSTSVQLEFSNIGIFIERISRLIPGVILSNLMELKQLFDIPSYSLRKSIMDCIKNLIILGKSDYVSDVDYMKSMNNLCSKKRDDLLNIILSRQLDSYMYARAHVLKILYDLIECNALPIRIYNTCCVISLSRLMDKCSQVRQRSLSLFTIIITDLTNDKLLFELDSESLKKSIEVIKTKLSKIKFYQSYHNYTIKISHEGRSERSEGRGSEERSEEGPEERSEEGRYKERSYAKNFLPEDAMNFPLSQNESENYPPPSDAKNFPPEDENNFPPSDARLKYSEENNFPLSDANHLPLSDANHLPISDANNLPLSDANHLPPSDADNFPRYNIDEIIKELSDDLKDNITDELLDEMYKRLELMYEMYNDALDISLKIELSLDLAYKMLNSSYEMDCKSSIKYISSCYIMGIKYSNKYLIKIWELSWSNNQSIVDCVMNEFKNIYFNNIDNNIIINRLINLIKNNNLICLSSIEKIFELNIIKDFIYFNNLDIIIDIILNKYINDDIIISLMIIRIILWSCRKYNTKKCINIKDFDKYNIIIKNILNKSIKNYNILFSELCLLLNYVNNTKIINELIYYSIKLFIDNFGTLDKYYFRTCQCIIDLSFIHLNCNEIIWTRIILQLLNKLFDDTTLYPNLNQNPVYPPTHSPHHSQLPPPPPPPPTLRQLSQFIFICGHVAIKMVASIYKLHNELKNTRANLETYNNNNNNKQINNTIGTASKDEIEAEIFDNLIENNLVCNNLLGGPPLEIILLSLKNPNIFINHNFNNTFNKFNQHNQSSSQHDVQSNSSPLAITSEVTANSPCLADSSPPEVQSNSLRLADSSPPEVQSNSLPLAVEASPNYLSLKSKATPGDRGDEEGSGMKSSTGPQVEPAADLREAEGEVNREAVCKTTSGGTPSGKQGDDMYMTSGGTECVDSLLNVDENFKNSMDDELLILRTVSAISLCKYACVSKKFCNLIFDDSFTILEVIISLLLNKSVDKVYTEDDDIYSSSLVSSPINYRHYNNFKINSPNINNGYNDLLHSTLPPLSSLFENQSLLCSSSLRCTLLMCYGDLLCRHPNIMEPWNDKIFNILMDDKDELKETGIIVFTHLVMNDMIKPKGKLIYNMMYLLIDNNNKIIELSKTFFNEINKKNSNTIYNCLPEIITTLANNKKKYTINNNIKILNIILNFIKKDKQYESIIEKIFIRLQSITINNKMAIAIYINILLYINYDDKCINKLIQSLSLIRHLIIESKPILATLCIINKKIKNKNTFSSTNNTLDDNNKYDELNNKLQLYFSQNQSYLNTISSKADDIIQELFNDNNNFFINTQNDNLNIKHEIQPIKIEHITTFNNTPSFHHYQSDSDDENFIPINKINTNITRLYDNT